MLSNRRTLLNKLLNKYSFEITGWVLDIGGKRYFKKGNFIKPKKNIKKWEYLNIDPSTNPDYCCNADDIPLKNETVDTILLLETLEYISNTDSVLEEVHRVLNRGGNCIISIPFLNPIHGDFRIDKKRYTEKYIKELIMRNGFSIKIFVKMGSIGSVIHDLILVSSTYAHPRKSALIPKLIRINLGLISPLFSFIDYMTEAQNNYITTGYFIIVKK